MAFNHKVFYSHGAKEDEHYHIKRPHIYKISSVKRNNAEIINNLNQIRDILSKNADPNSQQFLHEAVFLYFIYKDLELSKSDLHKHHDSSEPDNQLKLICLLLEYGANLTIFKHLGLECELATLRCFSNLWRQLNFGEGLSSKQMDGFSPVDYAAKFQHQYPEMYKLLKDYEEQVILKRISAAVQQFKI